MKYPNHTRHPLAAATLLLLAGATLAAGRIQAQSTPVANPDPAVTPPAPPLARFPVELSRKVKHIFILYPENRSSESLYGNIPGANGLANAKPENTIQTDRVGNPLASLPQPTTSGIPGLSGGPDGRFPSSLANAPYNIEGFVPTTSMQGDMVHRFYTEQYQINDKATGRYRADAKNAGGAALSKFTAWSDNPGLVMSHYDAQNLPEGQLFKQYVFADNNFHSAFGGSFLNHQWLIAARAPVWPAAPAEGSPPPAGTGADTNFDTHGYPALTTSGSLSDGAITADFDLPGFSLSNAAPTLGVGDYWAINTLRPLRGPAGGFSTNIVTDGSPTGNTPLASRLPLQTYDTIGDRLTAAGISWAWYSGGWNNAKAGKADYLFQFHHQPFAFFAKYALASTPVPQTATAAAVPGKDSPGSAQFLKDEDADFYPGLQNGTVPQVSFVKPIGENNSHPGYASVAQGQNWLGNIVKQIQASPYYADSVIFVMYDEHGGMWDHVVPPHIDSWGPGLRVPFGIISPFTKSAFVDHTQYETVSMLSFVEKVFKVRPLNTRDADAQPPVAAFVGQPDLIIRAYVGQPLSYQLPAYNGPTAFKIPAGTYLNGLTLDRATGLLTGTPTAVGSFTVKLKIRGAGGLVRYTARIDTRNRSARSLQSQNQAEEPAAELQD